MNDQNSSIWKKWADQLKQWNLQDFTAAFLEASDPVNLIGAQLIYISQPVLSGFISKSHLTALAKILEEPEETKAFISILRETAV